ncbi:uncharacterized protein V6R79_021952 [Siganus canaliculatus]
MTLTSGEVTLLYGNPLDPQSRGRSRSRQVHYSTPTANEFFYLHALTSEIICFHIAVWHCATGRQLIRKRKLMSKVNQSRQTHQALGQYCSPSDALHRVSRDDCMLELIQATFTGDKNMPQIRAAIKANVLKKVNLSECHNINLKRAVPHCYQRSPIYTEIKAFAEVEYD